jgi:Ca2+-binding RTX toxin-like protein
MVADGVLLDFEQGFGGPGPDTLFGGPLGDFIGGNGGGDLVLGGGGNDSVVGGIGNDHFNGEGGDDFLFGGDFNPDGSFVPNSGDDTLDGGDGNDGLWGADGNEGTGIRNRPRLFTTHSGYPGDGFPIRLFQVPVEWVQGSSLSTLQHMSRPQPWPVS